MGNDSSSTCLNIYYETKKGQNTKRKKQNTLNIIDKAVYDLKCLRNKYRHISEENFPKISELELKAKDDTETILTEAQEEKPGKEYPLSDFCEQ
jgi:hypothetical protein